MCKPSIIDAPWTPSPLVSQVSSLHHHPHQFQLVSLWTPLLTDLGEVFALCVPCAHHARALLRATFILTFPDSIPKFTITQ